MAGLAYDGLVVRLNSVQHLLDSLGGLERMVVERWAPAAWLLFGGRGLRLGWHAAHTPPLAGKHGGGGLGLGCLFPIAPMQL